MKKGLLFILFIAVLVSGVFGEPFYNDLNQAQRYDLGHAYLAVSEYFEDQGEPERAARYKIIADQILTSIPDLSESDVVEAESETVAAETTGPVVRPVDERTQKAILYYFNKLFTALTMGNTEKTLEGMSFPFIAGDYALDEEAIETDLLMLLALDMYDMTEYTPGDIWNLDSATFKWEEGGVVLTMETMVLDPEIFLFWQDPQDFHFVKQDHLWLLKGMD